MFSPRRRRSFPFLLLLGFAAYGYYGDGLNDGLSSMSFDRATLTSIYAQVAEVAPQLNGAFAIPRL